ncbi:hypothetical protein [Aurantimonas endophytica]|uniref:Uncharacterized protein n=1 Tax=Aurantimonas endophytica TaxID=1522175 RepID=A0A7W6H9G2_9HYPH|nr:hypothetical protein [Aurantimonas endophytica]MBB4000987.1 hypothetical protein [Aurantimonas endophytica]MCO6403355.1 hypothetical protein [Aurantimonas endophytica]
MSKWIPDRKVWSGGLFAVLAFLAVLASNTWAGTDIPIEAGAFIALGIGKAFEYILPPSVLDIIKRVDNDIVAIAGASPESKVSPEVGNVAAKTAQSDDAFEAIMKRMGR